MTMVYSNGVKIMITITMVMMMMMMMTTRIMIMMMMMMIMMMMMMMMIMIVMMSMTATLPMSMMTTMMMMMMMTVMAGRMAEWSVRRHVIHTSWWLQVRTRGRQRPDMVAVRSSRLKSLQKVHLKRSWQQTW